MPLPREDQTGKKSLRVGEIYGRGILGPAMFVVNLFCSHFLHTKHTIRSHKIHLLFSVPVRLAISLFPEKKRERMKGKPGFHYR